MATILDRVPVERISAEAREAQFGWTLLTLIAAVLFGVGFIAAKTLGAVWLALAWSGTAVKVGFTEGRGAAPATATKATRATRAKGG